MLLANIANAATATTMRLSLNFFIFTPWSDMAFGRVYL
jgi:hypothetical protein